MDWKALCKNRLGKVVYLINWTCSFVVMDMAIEGNINPILLPEILKAFPSHRLLKWALRCIPVIGRVAEHTMSSEYQPRLFLSICWCKALLYESVLFWPLSPVMFCISYTKPEQSIIRWIPDDYSTLRQLSKVPQFVSHAYFSLKYSEVFLLGSW